MKTTDEKDYLGCLTFVVFLLTTPIVIILNGITISYMWDWFFIEKFGLSTLNIVEAILLASLINFLTVKVKESKVRDNRDSSEKLTDVINLVLVAILHPFMALGLFYVIMLFL